jgi:hypothetical protein
VIGSFDDVVVGVGSRVLRSVISEVSACLLLLLKLWRAIMLIDPKEKPILYSISW